MSAGSGRSVHVVLRSHGGENTKARPDFYDKLTCLASLVRAVEELSSHAELVFVNDGPVPQNRADLMSSAGEVVTIDAGSNRASYRAALSLASDRGWPPEDLVWFAEDDYLYQPDSLVRLLDGAEALPQADYFSLHSPYALDRSAGRWRPGERPERGAAGDGDAVLVGATRWFHGLSTTSTFGVRVSVLRQDRRVLRLMPFTGGAWDHASCLVVQGLRPFSRTELRDDLVPFDESPGSWPRAVVRGLVRTVLSTAAIRRPSRRRVLMSSDPPVIAHLEHDLFGDPRAWESLTDTTRGWLADRTAQRAGASTEASGS